MAANRLKKNMPRIGGFQSFNTARRSIQGFEAMLWLRKGFGFAGPWTKDPAIRDLIEATGATLRFLPPRTKLERLEQAAKALGGRLEISFVPFA